MPDMRSRVPRHWYAFSMAVSSGPENKVPREMPHAEIAAAMARNFLKCCWTMTKLDSVTMLNPIPAERQTQLPLPHTFDGLFSMTTWVSLYQKGKTSLD